jgi:non-heme chloroperoxidase
MSSNPTIHPGSERWLSRMMGAIKAQYDCVKALSESEFFDDLKIIDIPVLVMDGEDDQICPFESSGASR